MKSRLHIAKLFGAAVFVLLLLGAPPIRGAGASPTDHDGDTIADTIDIDDDGDGILDIDETGSNFQYATYDPFTEPTRTMTGTIGSTNFTYTSSVNILTTAAMYEAFRFPTEYNVVSRNPTIRNDYRSTNTITFAEPVLNPTVVFASIGAPSTAVPVQFDRDVDLVWSKDVVKNTTSKITGKEGFAVLKIPGTISQFSFDYQADEAYVNFMFGADPRQAIDSDGDTLNNPIDLDSDDDGIPDNVEAQPSATYRAPSGHDSDGNGLDDAYEVTPGAGTGLRPVDTDGDGTADVLDLDSDADSKFDVDESGLGLTDDNDNGRSDGPKGANGLDNLAESADTYADPNGLAHNGTRFLLADTDDDTDDNGANASPRGQDFDWRDNRLDCNLADTALDCDGDGNLNGTDPHKSAPTAAADSLNARVGASSSVDILTNDDFATGSATTLRRTGGTAGGTVGFDTSAGTMSYRPASGEGGTTKTVVYEVCHVGTSTVCTTATVTITVAAAVADLTVTAADPGPVTPGSAATIVLTVGNLGPSDTAQTNVVYTPPAGAVVDTAALPVGCTADVPTSGSVTCAIGAVASGGTADLSLPVVVSGSAQPGTTLADGTVSVTSNGIDPVSSNSTNRPAPITVGDRRADLAITVDSAPALRPGATGALDLDVANHGPSDSPDFDVTYTLPLGVAFDTSGANPNRCERSATTITCHVDGPVAAGAHADLKIPVLMLTTQPTSGPIQPQTATLGRRTVADPVSSNDSVDTAPSLDLTGDSNGDGISDADQIDPDGTGRPSDRDGDGIPDYLDQPGVDVSGEVFLDLDRDGVLDLGEASVSGVVVRLVAPGPDASFGTADDVTVATARTASPYRFTGVRPGRYRVVIDTSTLPRGVYGTDDADGSRDASIELSVGSANIRGQNFGSNYALVTGVVRGEDGRPIANARVTFTDSAGNTFTAVTDMNGNYRFEGSANTPIIAGAATISATTPDGRTITSSVDVSGAISIKDLAATSASTPTGRGVPDSLAFTGSDGSSTMWIAFLTIGFGLTMVTGAWARRRNA